eukprot:SAG31_NODE_2957_length_4857_cov_47.100883_8_plen_107_part_00
MDHNDAWPSIWANVDMWRAGGATNSQLTRGRKARAAGGIGQPYMCTCTQRATYPDALLLRDFGIVQSKFSLSSLNLDKFTMENMILTGATHRACSIPPGENPYELW